PNLASPPPDPSRAATIPPTSSHSLALLSPFPGDGGRLDSPSSSRRHPPLAPVAASTNEEAGTTGYGDPGLLTGRSSRSEARGTGSRPLHFPLSLSILFLSGSAEACDDNGRAGGTSRRRGITGSRRLVNQLGQGATRSVALTSRSGHRRSRVLVSGAAGSGAWRGSSSAPSYLLFCLFEGGEERKGIGTGFLEDAAASIPSCHRHPLASQPCPCCPTGPLQ
uniref:Uncharacterized protein n=1 Tax=Oryza meridionalis TaxID=40149 RepID=A0A0E0DYN8_9ORYZ